MKTIGCMVICIVVILLLPIMANAHFTNTFEVHNSDNELIMFSGSGFYIKQSSNESIFVKFLDISDKKVTNLNSRWAEFMLIKNGNYIEKVRCYNYDICQLKYVKFKINHIFVGREAVATFIEVLRIYE
jgi:hypothetical protein